MLKSNIRYTSSGLSSSDDTTVPTTANVYSLHEEIETTKSTYFVKVMILPERADMNNYTDPFYIYANSSTAEITNFINKPANSPIGEMALFFLPLGTTNYALQIYFAKDGGNHKIYSRTKHSSSWGSWTSWF